MLSWPHTLALLALTALSLTAQQYYRLRDNAVMCVNAVFFALVVALFWHSSKVLNKKKR